MSAKNLIMKKCFPGGLAPKTSKSLLKAAVLAFAFLWSVQGVTQSDLVCDGTPHTVAFSGTFQDFLVPSDSTVGQIQITLKGGDGGFARLGNLCKSDGGEGATVFLILEVGNGDGKIPHGSTLRFVVGRAGEKGTGEAILGTGFTYGGGGGGTGLLYKAPGSDTWLSVAVAGGGGGAYQGAIVGICVDNEEGQGGRAGQNGGDGNGDIEPGQGGSSGSGGQAGGISGLEISGGGGGQWHAGSGITCTDISQFYEVAEGQSGFPEGGAGGGSEGCVSFTFRDGGYGFGGGGSGVGAGGGGGGFSGGGGGGTTGRGGGGGSYANLNYTSNPQIQEGGTTGETEDGYALYKCVLKQQPPVASCTDSEVSLALNEIGIATLDISLIDDGSFDPDGGQLSLSLSPNEFDCANLGANTVALTVKDDNGMTASCSVTVQVIDNLAPALTCLPSVVQTADPGACEASVFFSEGLSASDNCTFSLSFSVPVNSVFSVGDTEVTATATDESGNSTNCKILVRILDEVAPAINCPANTSVNCGQNSSPEALGNAVGEDLCSAFTVSFQDSATGSDCTPDQAIVRIWTAEDSPGNKSTCTQTISITPDQTAPVINCPANISVTCGEDIPESAMATATDNCTVSPELSFTDTVIDGDCAWACKVQRVWAATDACGNTSVCNQIIDKSALGLIEDALDTDINGDGQSDPILIGRSGRTSLILKGGSGACLIQWLPTTGGIPAGLPRGEFTLDGSNCYPANYPFNGDGQLNNPFLGEAITLSIYLRLHPDFGNTPLTSLGCNIHPIVFQGLPPNPTVNDLMAQTNLILANSFAPFYTYFTSALACINDDYNLCSDNPGGERPAIGSVQAAHIPPISDRVTAFPNPTTGELFVSTGRMTGSADLAVFAVDGRLMFRRQAEVEEQGDPIRLDLAQLKPGVYFLEIRTDAGRVTERIVVE